MHLIVIAVPVPQIQEQIVELTSGSADATDPGTDCGSDQ